MTKHLRIEVNGIEYVNGEFAEISFTDGPNGVKVEGKPVRQSGGGGGGLLDLLSGGNRARPEPVAQEKKSSIADQPVVVGEPVVAEVIEQA